MLRLHAKKFVQIINHFSRAEEMFKAAGAGEEIDEKSKAIIISWLGDARTICQEIGLPMSMIQIDKVKRYVGLESLTPQNLITVFAELNSRVLDEVSIPVFLVMKRDKIDYYEKPNLFGDEVFNNFPSANFDIEEAGKCFATARYTACVMHLQRVLEISLKSYGNYLGIMNLIATPQPSWNLVLDQTRKEIKERNDKQNTNKVWASNDEKEFCEGIQPFLEAVKTAWRNPSMHADKIYGEEIAEDIFSAIKRFMKHLAKHLDESGNFTP